MTTSPPAVRTRTRTVHPVPEAWPNGAEVYRGKDHQLMGWSIRLPSKGERLWLNENESPRYLGDFPTFSEGLVRLSTEFDKKTATRKAKT